MKKNIARMLLWSVLFNALSPLAAFAQNNYYRPRLDKVAVPKIKMNSSRVHKEDVTVDLTDNDAALAENDVTKGRDSCCQKQSNCRPKPKCFDADYIIIGMGGAGAVIAERLSADKKTSVIGLEAGDNNSNDEPIIVPQNGYLQLFPNFFPQYFWQGDGVPQYQLDGVSYPWSSGRLLGGGTSINGMQYLRGTNAYWSDMAELLGPDWSLDKTLARYKELETFISPFTASDERGTNGPWNNVALPFNPTEDDEYFFKAQLAVSGLPEIDDFNDPETPNGSSIYYDTSERPVGDVFLREATSYAFLGADVMTPNGFGIDGRKLRVHLNSTAIDLLWNDNKVIGVRYTQNGKCHEIFAKEEVIVSAGFQSAQFLQRNGIGPKDVLNAAGVPVRIENALVGQLLNHVYTCGIIIAPPGTVLLPEDEPWTIWAPGSTLPAITHFEGTINTRREFTWIGAPLFTDADGNVFVLFCAGAMAPKSVGTIKIQNDDPFKIPLVDGNYLGDQEDIDTLVTAWQHFGLDLARYLRDNPSDKGTWFFASPTIEVMENPDPTDLINFIKETASQAHHYSSTVPAGFTPDVGVVDPYGRVFGAEGLRVADVSILPYIPDGNTGAPAVLIGWTISEFILAGK